MGRFRNFARAIASGYAAIGANVLFTIFSVPIALDYLNSEEFGVWAIVLQICGYLALVELGMTGSVYRFLIDHKDSTSSVNYRTVISTGTIVFAVQGLLLGLLGWFFAPGLSRLLSIGGDYTAVFIHLVRWQSVVTALGLMTRGLSVPLQSHQRFDVLNYLQIIGLLFSFAAQWACLASGWGLESLPIATAFGTVLQALGGWAAATGLKLVPRWREWVAPQKAVFRQLLTFGRDVFLLTLGAQLFFASQLIIVGGSLGLEAAAAWAICTKAFTLVQQFVLRIPDFATPALTEMYVRDEHPRLTDRFRSVMGITVLGAILLGGVIAVANQSFVTVWTKGLFQWNPWNNILAALLLVSVSLTRCLTMCVGFDKRVAAFRYVYFFQGATFIASAWFAAPAFGFTGVLACALLADLLWCGIYGLKRTALFFATSPAEVIRWLCPQLRFGVFFGAACTGVFVVAGQFPVVWQMVLGGTAASGVGLLMLWLIGLTNQQRDTVRAHFNTSRKNRGTAESQL